jgi:hypothetical protein
MLRQVGFRYDNWKQRLASAGLLAGVVSAVLSHTAECPSWSLGIPCPACGMSRATSSLLAGDVMQAFSFNLMFPYWLFIASAVMGSFFLYAVGLLRLPDSLGKWVLDAIPIKIHATFWTVSCVSNFFYYGLNPNGFGTRIFMS